jgi:DNA-binding MarR family transcriptional regulator/GNAT superfamily N-acetyltransferase
LIDTISVTLADDTAKFRRFNRLYTRFLGTLQEGMLNTEFSLAEARVLYELATRKSPKAKEILDELEIDPGYMSRLLGKFERAGLLKRKASERDGRFSELALTRRGRSAFRKLDALSDEQASGVLGPLAQADRAKVIAAMQTIEDVVVKPGKAPRMYVLRQHRPGDMGWVVSREGAVYAEEYGWDQTFEALVARIVADFITDFDPNRERCWIAETDGKSRGHIFLVKHPVEPATAKLRLLFVEPGARGMGLGAVLVNECIRFARQAGYGKITLWTQSVLVSAHRIYQGAGFRLTEETLHHSFGKDLVGQTWELEL